MKHAIYQLDYMDNLFKLIMPKSNDKGEYISVKQRLAELKRLQVQRKLNRTINMLRKKKANNVCGSLPEMQK